MRSEAERLGRSVVSYDDGQRLARVSMKSTTPIEERNLLRDRQRRGGQAAFTTCPLSKS